MIIISPFRANSILRTRKGGFLVAPAPLVFSRFPDNACHQLIDPPMPEETIRSWGRGESSWFKDGLQAAQK